MTPAAALAWLNDLMQWLGRWVPRLTLVPPTHRAVLFGPRGGTRQSGPGLVLYWPMTHQLIQIPVTTQSIQLCARSLWLKDDAEAVRIIPRVAVCAIALQFRVHDPVKAATSVLHLLALVDNRAVAAVARAWKGDVSDVTFIDMARVELAEVLQPYGVTLERCDIVSTGVGVVMKQFADWSYTDREDGRRPD